MSPPLQEPEVQLAQRLASNEKPIRSKAIKKLRKYISVRSQKGGFTGDELLKLWKGLFYCLWMQDKLLLQEELSNQISLLLHSFHHVDSQFLYLESFLQTMKREWTGIDGLRMDKFFQLVRFMFRQTFEMLKRKNWETSVVGRFLELLTAQVLQGGSAAPSGLQFHILDIYMTELAATGSAELTADQNLVFIEPFCRTAAKTKDRILFNAICGSILSTIIDQAPFAIEDLMKEMKAAQASDSGQASEEEEEEEEKSKPASKKATGKQMNGSSLGTKSDDEEEEDDEDDELLHLEDSDSELPDDGGIGPVLQFDYSALANKLLELASRSNTPSQNRQRLYKIIKLLRDLSEGVFPQNEYPEEVSTDEDDDEMFGSRKRMKRRKRFGEEEEEEGGPAAKKRKGKKKDASKLSQQNKDSTNDDNEPAESVTNNDKKKKKRKKKKKKKDAGQGKGVGGEEKANGPEQVIDVGSLTDADTQKSAIKDTETAAGAQEGSPPIEAEKEAKMETSVRVTEAVTPTDTEGQSEIRVLLEVKNQSVRVTDEASEPEPRATEDTEDQSETLSKKKRKKSEVNSEIPEPTVEVTEAAGEQPAPVTQEVEAAVAAVEPETSPEATTPGKKKSKKKSLEAEKKADEVEAEAEGGNTVAEITSITGKASEDTTTPLKKKTKKGKQEVKMAQGAEATDLTPEDVSLEAAIAEESANDTPLKKKKKKKKSQKTSETEELEVVEETTAVAETPQEVDAEEPSSEITLSTPAKKKKKKQKAAQVSEVKGEIQSEVAGDADEEPPACEAPPESEALPSSVKKGKKKRKIPVVFEFEADEAATNGVEEDDAKKAKLGNEVEETPTPLGSKKSKKKKAGTESDFITFQSNASIPRPLFYKTKGSPSTPLSGKKKRQTPTSDSKKVTFGLKNNKTAEFRKTDRSLLVSPEGSSRVPFDPEQKPKFGVLKSPVIKKTLKANKTPKNTPKRRPVAADFF